METVAKQHPPLRQAQKDAMVRKRIFIEQVASVLIDAIDNTSSTSARSARALENLLSTDDARRGKRYIPLCHIYPRSPMVMYSEMSTEHFTSWDTEVVLQEGKATTNVLMLNTEHIGFVINEFQTICCAGSLLAFVTKQRFMNSNLLVRCKRELEEMGMDEGAIWIIRPLRVLDACDIIGVPDEKMLDVGLPDIIKNRILRYGSQYHYNKEAVTNEQQ